MGSGLSGVLSISGPVEPMRLFVRMKEFVELEIKSKSLPPVLSCTMEWEITVWVALSPKLATPAPEGAVLSTIVQ